MSFENIFESSKVNANDAYTREDPSHAGIDWDAPMYDYDAACDASESLPPPNRAIYPLNKQKGWKVTVTSFNPEWPQQFLDIRTHISTLLSRNNPPVNFASIEHIGSTAIPNLAAKPNIDVLVILPTKADLRNALEAFEWEVPSSTPFVRYTRVPNGGGIQGRESLKLYVPDWSPYYHTTPERSVYLINGDASANPAGQVQIRSYRSFKHVLLDPANNDLLQEYAKVKLSLATRVFPDSITYSSEKDVVVRKILRRAGWTEEEIDEKERLSVRVWTEQEPPY